MLTQYLGKEVDHTASPSPPPFFPDFKLFISFPCNFPFTVSQKAFNEQFYEEDEQEKPVFEDDLDDDIGQYQGGALDIFG